MNFLKKQGVAWVITVVMIVIAIGIGTTAPPPFIPGPCTPVPPDSGTSGAALYVWDDANVLSASEEAALSEINAQLSNKYGTVVACVTTNYGRDDLYDFALDYADRVGLQQYDFIVVLDISGENYWLVQGSGLLGLFSDEQCGEYAWNYMEKHFARGDYGQALLSLMDGLAQWYEDHYTG